MARPARQTRAATPARARSGKFAGAPSATFDAARAAPEARRRGGHGRVRGHRGTSGTGQRAGLRLRAGQHRARRARSSRSTRCGAPSRATLPMVVGGPRRARRPASAIDVVEPHRTEHVVGTLREATTADVRDAVDAALAAAPAWRATAFRDRAAIFLRAADLLAGPWRARFAAATMLGQSKSVVPVRDRRGLRAVRLPAVRGRRRGRALRAPAARLAEGPVEPDGPPPPRGVRARDLAVQLHLDRGEPAVRAGAHGQHGRVEAEPDPAALRVAVDGPARRRRAPAGRREPRHRHRGPRSPRSPSSHPSLAGIHFTGSTATFRHLWGTVAANLERLPLVPAPRRARPAARTSSSRTRARTPTRSSPGSCAARSTTRARSAPRPRGRTCPAPSRRAGVLDRLADEAASHRLRRRRGPVGLRRRGHRPAQLRPPERRAPAARRRPDDRGHRRRHRPGQGRLLRRPDGRRRHRPRARGVHDGVLRPDPLGPRLRRRAVLRRARPRRHDVPLRAHGRGLRDGPRGDRRGDRARCATRRGTST